MVLDAAGSVYGTSSNCGSAGRVSEGGFRDYTVASRLSEMHNLSRRLSLLNRDSDLRGVLDLTRVRRSSHADHIARRLPGGGETHESSSLSIRTKTLLSGVPHPKGSLLARIFSG